MTRFPEHTQVRVSDAFALIKSSNWAIIIKDISDNFSGTNGSRIIVPVEDLDDLIEGLQIVKAELEAELA